MAKKLSLTIGFFFNRLNIVDHMNAFIFNYEDWRDISKIRVQILYTYGLIKLEKVQ